MNPKNPDDQLLSRAYGAVASVGVLFAAVGFWCFGLKFGASVLVGALVALGNLWVLARSVRNFLRGRQAKWAGIAALKFVGLLVVTLGLIRSGLLDPLALAGGFGALPFGIFIAGTFFASADSSLVEETDHA